ncbi:hypothetical protein LJR230_004655 [Trinickia sp. LjRoot230]|uniref:hypothetical protein n=1 Tax=Trinickia sp. LjRoot230 TaxID=3342288 RepID=UPI003ECE221D
MDHTTVSAAGADVTNCSLKLLPSANTRVPFALGVSAEIKPLGLPPAAAVAAEQVILPLDVDVDVDPDVLLAVVPDVGLVVVVDVVLGAVAVAADEAIQQLLPIP